MKANQPLFKIVTELHKVQTWAKTEVSNKNHGIIRTFPEK